MARVRGIARWGILARVFVLEKGSQADLRRKRLQIRNYIFNKGRDLHEHHLASLGAESHKRSTQLGRKA